MMNSIMTYFDEIKIGVEVILILVIIAGFIHSRMLVKRISVLKGLFQEFRKMENELDAAVQKALDSFESIQHKMIAGEKRMNFLIESAKNVEEDIELQKNEVADTEASLSKVLKQASNQERSIKEQIRYGKGFLKRMDERTKDENLPSQKEDLNRDNLENPPLEGPPQNDTKEREEVKEEKPQETLEASFEQVEKNKADEKNSPTQNPLMQNRPYARR